jgi:hypothetical protein
MEFDAELETWRREWQADGAPPGDLQQRVERETRTMRALVIAEIAVTIVFGGGSVAWALASRSPDAPALIAGIWVFIAICWATSRVMRKGTWTPAAATTAAFLDLSILRCRRRYQEMLVTAVLYVFMLAFSLVWIYQHEAQRMSLEPRTYLTSWGVMVVWVISAALGAVAVWQRRRIGRELKNLIELREQTTDSIG